VITVAWQAPATCVNVVGRSTVTLDGDHRGSPVHCDLRKRVRPVHGDLDFAPAREESCEAM
jgi:hypothetical protein